MAGGSPRTSARECSCCCRMMLRALPAWNHSICSWRQGVGALEVDGASRRAWWMRHCTGTSGARSARPEHRDACRPRRSRRRWRGRRRSAASTPCFLRLVSWMRAKRAGDDRPAVAEAGLHGGVLAGRALAVVLVADRDPRARRPRCSAWRCRGTARSRRRAGPCPAPASPGEGVDGAEEQVAADVLEVAAVTCSHGPAAEMWSVVHLPLALTRTGSST